MDEKEEAKGERWRKTFERMKAEKRKAKELDALLPLIKSLPKSEQRKRLPAEEQWTRDQREEMSKMAEDFLKAQQADRGDAA